MRIKNALVYTVEHGFVERDVRIKNGCFFVRLQYAAKNGFYA